MTDEEYKNRLKGKTITYRNSLELPKNITFGIEIEYENIVNDTLSVLLEEEKYNNFNLYDWINKREFHIAEVNKFGEEVNGEINSPILKDNWKTWRALSDMLNLLNNNNAIISEKCGGHVNIGSHILKNKNEYYRNLFLLWILYNKEIYDFSKGEYLKLRSNDDGFFNNIMSDIDLKRIININRERYLDTISECLFDKLHDIFIRGRGKKLLEGNTIEFRIPNGTLSEEIWQNYINFFTKFLLAYKKDLDVEYTLYKIKNGIHSASELADYVFDTQIDKNNFLIQTLKTNKIYKKTLQKHIKYIKKHYKNI